MRSTGTSNILVSFGAVILVVSLLFLCFTFNDGVASFKKPVDIFEESYRLKDISETDMAESEIRMLLGRYYEFDFTGSGSYDYYYILPVTREGGTYYMGLKVPSDECSEYDKMSDDIQAYLNRELAPDQISAISIKGRIVKMNDKNKAAFRSWFKQQGYRERDYDHLLYYYISIDSNDRVLKTFWVMIAGIVIGMILIAAGCRMILRKNKAKKEQVCVVIKGVSYPKALFERANTFMTNRETVFAIQEISNITGLDMKEAQMVAANWDQYYL